MDIRYLLRDHKKNTSINIAIVYEKEMEGLFPGCCTVMASSTDQPVYAFAVFRGHWASSRMHVDRNTDRALQLCGWSDTRPRYRLAPNIEPLYMMLKLLWSLYLHHDRHVHKLYHATPKSLISCQSEVTKTAQMLPDSTFKRGCVNP